MARRPRLTFQDSALLDPARQAMLLDRGRQLGFTGIQQDMSWGDVYKGGAFDFSKYDAMVNAARAKGYDPRRMTFRLFGTPVYQKGVDATLSASHPNAALAGKFAEAVAGHFAGRVGNYGVWNEPNVPSFLNKDIATAASTYRLLYRQMRKSIKGADPHAKVGLGEITSQQPNTPGAMSTVGFLKAVLGAGHVPLRADYVGIHPYQWSNPNTKPGNAWYGGISNLDAVQDELAKQAHAGKLLTGAGGRVPLRLTEFGYKHDAQSNPHVRAQWLGRALQMANEAGVDDVNLYQLLPSKKGDYWDSSVLDARGRAREDLRRALARISSVPVR